MQHKYVFAALATFTGLAFTTLHIPSDANVTAVPVEDAALYIKASDIVQYGQPNRLTLQSSVVAVMDEREGVMIFGRNVDRPRPIASLTKLMTALVILDSNVPLEETIQVTREDRDRLRGTRSRLPFGGVFTRYDLLRAALGASDNRAAAALGRTFPGGLPALLQAMNLKAQELGMTQTRFADSSGLNNNNVSTARDLLRLVAATQKHAQFQTLTTTAGFRIANHATHREIAFHNTSRLVRKETLDISLSKTGYTAAAGNCLLMQVTIANRPLTIVLLDSWGKLSRYADVKRIDQWLKKAERRVPPLQTASASTI